MPASASIAPAVKAIARRGSRTWSTTTRDSFSRPRMKDDVNKIVQSKLWEPQFQGQQCDNRKDSQDDKSQREYSARAGRAVCGRLRRGCS